MKLLEKDAKGLLAAQGIRIPEGFLVEWGTNAWPKERGWAGPYYLKSQVLAGRRGKGGLVQRVTSPEEFARVLQDLQAQLSPDVCGGFWCERECPHTEEWFVACDIEYASAQLRAHVSQEGGKEVAKVHTFFIQDLEHHREMLPTVIFDLLERLFLAMRQCDALSIELNPCMIASDGLVTALDAKIELDEAAAFRHPEWKDFLPLSRFGAVTSPREQAYMDLLIKTDRPLLGKYVELTGTIAVILAGGGASLVAMDALKRAGGRAANYLELSGNPDPDFLREATKIVFSHPAMKAIWIAGSFANFTDIHATVMAILRAVEEVGAHVPIVIRRDGPGANEAEQAAIAWAKEKNTPLLFQRGSVDLAESAAAVVRVSQM